MVEDWEPDDGEEVLVSLPKSLLVAIGVPPERLGQVVRESVAVDLYRCRMISFGKAMEVAGMASNAAMLDLLAQHDVWLSDVADDGPADAAAFVERLTL